jgi:hypothetical protein
LHVNPFEYLARTNRSDPALADEASYNAALVEACVETGVEVIAVTDHYRIKSSASLMAAATDAGIVVLPGFEAVTKDGVHLLCLFNQDTPADRVDRVIGACGVHDLSAPSPQGDYDVAECLDKAGGWECTFVAAHVCSNGGLLSTLKGTPRMRAWCSPNLQACSLPASAAEAPQEYRQILQNQDPKYARDHRVAVLNAQDVYSPAGLSDPGCTCWIKMSEVSIEGFRQAFLEPESRVRLASDPEPDDHTEIVGIAWEGGFLDGQALHFNENLNVLVGGRGTGKSTVVESVRYVLGLQPVGEEALRNHDGIIRGVLRNGTRVSLVVRSHHPAVREYVIERTLPHSPIVRDIDGTVLDVLPQDVVPNVEVFGQHEIAELVRSPERLTRLLDRFMDQDAALTDSKATLKRDLENNRRRTVAADTDLAEVESKLARLPALQETLRRFKDAGLEEKLADKDALIREESVLSSGRTRVRTIQDLIRSLRDGLPLDREFCSESEVKDLPSAAILKKVEVVLSSLSGDLQIAVDKIETRLDEAVKALDKCESEWAVRKDTVEGEFAKVLRELQADKVDGQEFVRIRQQIEQLKPARDRKRELARELAKLGKQRRTMLAQWSDAQGEEFRRLSRVAEFVSRRLDNRVRVRVDLGQDLGPLNDLLKSQLKGRGRLAESLEAFGRVAGLSMLDLAAAIQTGAVELQRKFGIPVAQANILADAGPELPMLVQETELPVTTQLELNVAADGHPESWQSLPNLSTGQKATAVLLLVLLESDAPLVVDQPEDDLDNRFISEGVVPRMLQEKRRRQFLFATHNANIPVLGDAELILGLRAMGEAEAGHAEVPVKHMGSIDSADVRDLVEEVLEGGKEAFQTRRLKYGF